MRQARIAAVAGLAWLGASGPATGQLTGEWLAGDLHVHTTYSHDSWDPIADDNTNPMEDPEDVVVLGHSTERQFLIAALRGLDYLAITDHNDVRSQSDPGFGAFGVIPIPSYENSLAGHAQMHGATRVFEKDGKPLQQLADELRAEGGVFQVNHPAGESTDFPNDADWAEARDGSFEGDVVPDVIEIWNIAWLWQPPFPSSNSIDDAVRWWEGWLDRGERVGATGGSDNHWVSVTPVAGVGQPTTWVFAEDRTPVAVLEGLRRGRTSISFQPPLHLGPRIFLEADGDGDGVFESIVGDDAALGSNVRVRTEGAPPGSFVRLLTSAGEVERVPVVELDFAHTRAIAASDFAFGKSRWIRADLLIDDLPEARASICDDAFGSQTTYCRNRLLVLAMTSAIYVAD